MPMNFPVFPLAEGSAAMYSEEPDKRFQDEIVTVPDPVNTTSPVIAVLSQSAVAEDPVGPGPPLSPLIP
jgi:hypothetical protein